VVQIDARSTAGLSRTTFAALRRFLYKRVPERGKMRGLTVLDVLIIAAVVAVLLFAASREFSRYNGRTLSPVPTSPPASQS